MAATSVVSAAATTTIRWALIRGNATEAHRSQWNGDRVRIDPAAPCAGCRQNADIQVIERHMQRQDLLGRR